MKKLLVFILSVIMACSFLSCADSDNTENSGGDTGNTTVNTDKANNYSDILDNLTAKINAGIEDFEAAEGEEGIEEIVKDADSVEEALSDIGYAIADITEDGIPELLIGEVDKDEDGIETENILAVYSMVDGSPMLQAEGTSENHMYVFFTPQLLGVDTSVESRISYNIYDITDEGLFLNNAYIQEGPDDSGNLDGMLEWALLPEMEALSDYIGAISNSYILDPIRAADAFAAGWADDLLNYYLEVESYELSDDPQANVAVVANYQMDDVVIHSLTPEVTADGDVHYDETELYKLGTLYPGHPLELRLTFEGDSAQYGISGVEPGTGIERSYAITLSGNANSVLLVEYEGGQG